MSETDDAGPEVIGVRHGMFGASGSGDTSGYGRLVRTVALPGGSPRPYGGYFDAVVDRLAELLADDFDDAVQRVVVYRGQITLHVERDRLPTVAQLLRDDEELRFELCAVVYGVHYPDDTARERHAVDPRMPITHPRLLPL